MNAPTAPTEEPSLEQMRVAFRRQEVARQRTKAWIAEHRNEHRATVREWYRSVKADPDRYAAYMAKRREQAARRRTNARPNPAQATAASAPTDPAHTDPAQPEGAN